MESPELSIVIPVYNEQESLPELRRRLEKTLSELKIRHEMVMIDDGSTDGSHLLLSQFHKSNPCFRILTFSRNFGHQAAITAGIDHACGSAVIIMDADLQDPPELIPELLAKWREGYEIVYAQRRERKNETWFKKTTAKIFYWLIRKISHIEIPYNVGDFRLLDKKVVNILKNMREYHRFLRGMMTWIGFRQTAVTFDREARFAGKTHYTLRKMILFAIDGVSSFSRAPLRLATYAGFVIALLSFAAAIYTLVSKFIYHNTIQGWASLMTAVLFLGGIQLMALGMVGEYIGRIYEEGKKRPLYIIKSQDDAAKNL